MGHNSADTETPNEAAIRMRQLAAAEQARAAERAAGG